MQLRNLGLIKYGKAGFVFFAYYVFFIGLNSLLFFCPATKEPKMPVLSRRLCHRTVWLTPCR
jgi:hypothetical protein